MSERIEITTNNHRREVIDGWQLTPDERAEFDYIDWEAIDRADDRASFVRFHGELIDLGEMDGPSYGSPMPDAFSAWHTYRSDSVFSGLVFRYPVDQFNPVNRATGETNYDYDSVVIGQYYVKG